MLGSWGNQRTSRGNHAWPQIRSAWSKLNPDISQRCQKMRRSGVFSQVTSCYLLWPSSECQTSWCGKSLDSNMISRQLERYSGSLSTMCIGDYSITHDSERRPCRLIRRRRRELVWWSWPTRLDSPQKECGEKGVRTISNFSLFVCGPCSKSSPKLLTIDDFQTSRGNYRNFRLFDYVEIKQRVLRQFWVLVRNKTQKKETSVDPGTPKCLLNALS